MRADKNGRRVIETAGETDKLTPVQSVLGDWPTGPVTAGGGGGALSQREVASERATCDNCFLCFRFGSRGAHVV